MGFINNYSFVVFSVLFKGVEHEVEFPIGGDSLDINPNSETGKHGTSNVPKQSDELNEVYYLICFDSCLLLKYYFFLIKTLTFMCCIDFCRMRKVVRMMLKMTKMMTLKTMGM